MSSAVPGNGQCNHGPSDRRQDRIFELVSGYGPDVGQLCHAYPALMPGTGLGLAAGTSSAVPKVRFAGDPGIARLEALQDALDEGPGRDANRLRQAVRATDLTDPSWRLRWPRFTAAALDAGVRSVYALPLHAGGSRHAGAVTVYRGTPGTWGDAHRKTIETFTAAATELLTLQHRGLDPTGAFTDARRDRSILLLAAGAPLDPRPGLATDHPDVDLPLIRWFQQADLPAVRTHLQTVATHHALADADRYRFVLAAHEAMTNAVLHGGGHGQLLLWQGEGHLWCEVSDHGPGLSGTSLPIHRPGSGTPDCLAPGHGLWLIQQACTSLDIITDSTGTRLLLGYRLPSYHRQARRPAFRIGGLRGTRAASDSK
ncbi:ATP-binding protein [Actinoplanes sp. NEAU-A12]|uniref:ATP-binding protein n=1 Tax=Actinoplanes sandaracinus TaxID=3045177 RepID=A0ABT6WZF2_9ACTN|nr:ATP-binding protein [Actinoplanes sandaracinus]MDI6105135.1 ATP-binding protein [Actinoplanes sandaracinus]